MPAKKADKKVFDVAKPGTMNPTSGTAKPVIVSNRPIIQDPMVVPGADPNAGNGMDSAAAPDTSDSSAPKKSPSRTSIVIQPLSDDVAPETDKPADAAPAAEPEPTIELKPVVPDEPTPDADAPAPEEATPPAEESGSKITITAPEIKDKDAASKIEIKTIDSVSDPVAKPDEPAAEEEAKAEDDKPGDSEGSDAAEEKPAETGSGKRKRVDIRPLGEKPGEEKPADKTAGTAPTTSDSIPDKPSDSAGTPTSENADAAAAAADAAKLAADAKAQEELDKIVDSKQYFLPIRTREQRRSRIVLILGILFAVLLVAAWVNIALDAGFVQIPGVKPFTDMF